MLSADENSCKLERVSERLSRVFRDLVIFMVLSYTPKEEARQMLLFF
jgi:hypothetical protein